MSSFVAEVLPLVEFVVTDDIELQEVRQLIDAEPPFGQVENPLQEQVVFIEPVSPYLKRQERIGQKSRFFSMIL